MQKEREQKNRFIDKFIRNIDKIDRIDVERQFVNLTREKGFLESIFNNLNEGISVLGNTGLVIYLNPEAKRVLGIFSENYRGKHFSEMIKDENLVSSIPVIPKDFHRVIDKEVKVNFPRNILLNTTIIPFKQGTSQLMVIVLKDITAKKTHERNEEQSKILETFSQLAAGMAHEIGNPLDSLNIHLQLISRELKKENKRKTSVANNLAVCQDELKRLDEIVNRFLSALRSSKRDLEEKNLNKIILYTVKLMQPEFNARKISLTVKLSNALSETLLDEAQIKQLIINILKNSIQAIYHEKGNITVSTSQEPYYILMEITDNGCGISKSVKNKIFEPYYSTKESGSGLGLLIASRIVTEHGGTIELESTEGLGTTVKVRIPIRIKKIRLLPEGKRSRKEKAASR